MIKQSANNTFGEGLMMDMNPLTTPNTVMTNCLNGTLVTFNGNEYMLQNDMGNGRVETAYLPEGYIPMGTCELGGIIYIVSYNPLQGTCQIGSFPSPERNISSDERNSPIVTLTNSSFGWSKEPIGEEKIEKGTIDGATKYYIKIDLDPTLTLNPGDKFIVYGSNLDANSSKLYFKGQNETYKLVKLSLGTVTSEGKLVIFDEESLKPYKLNDNTSYYINESQNGELSSSDVDDYRNIIEQPFNIFNSKVQGSLVLIAELIACEDFDVSISHTFIEEEPNKETEKTDEDIKYKIYNPTFTVDLSGNTSFVPYFIKLECNILDKPKTSFYWRFNPKIVESKEFIDIQIPADYFINQDKVTLKDFIKEALGETYFMSNTRNKVLLDYTITPCMHWGPVTHLAIEGQIDLQYIGSGYINLNTWKYFNSGTTCNLTWGLEAYEEENKHIKDVTMTFQEVTSTDYPNKDKEGGWLSFKYAISKKNSYHGTFYESIPFNQSTYRLDGGQLQPNKLYLVTIKYEYGKEGEWYTDSFQRWLFTNTMYNNCYSNTQDFGTLNLKKITLNTKLDTSYSTNITPTGESNYKGKIRTQAVEGSEQPQPKDTLSVKQMQKRIVVQGSSTISLEDNYNIFSIQTSDGYFQLQQDTNEQIKLEIESTNKYLTEPDDNMDKFLKPLIYKEYDGKFPPLPTECKPDKFISENTEIEQSEKYENGYGNGVNVDTFNSEKSKENKATFEIGAILVTIAKAYSKVSKKICNSSGKILPLAYNDETYEKYGLAFKNKKINEFVTEDIIAYPTAIGTYCSYEPGGKKGRNYVGLLTSGGYTGSRESDVPRGNNLDFEWTRDRRILDQMIIQGWRKNMMFTLCYLGEGEETDGNNNEWRLPNDLKINVTDENGFYHDTKVFTRDMRFPQWAVKEKGGAMMIAMKSNSDDFYHPINCAAIIDLSSMSVDSTAGHYKDYTSYQQNKKVQAVDFYTFIASILNNLYRYSSEISQFTYFLPESIYYGDDYKYTIKIPVTVKRSEDSTTFMKLYINKKVDVLALAKSITNDESLQASLEYNINDTINSKEQDIIISLSDSYVGKELRNIFLEAQNTEIGVIVTDKMGNDVGNYQPFSSFSPNEVLWINKDGKAERATSYLHRKRKFILDSEGKLSKIEDEKNIPNNNPEQGYNIYNNFVLDNEGVLLVKDPPVSEMTMRIHTQDTGYGTGFVSQGLCKEYEFWKKI